MSSITASKVTNALDGDRYLFCSEWDELKIKFTVIKPDNTVFIGEILQEEFHKYAKTYDKPFEQYLQELKEIFKGLNNDIKFYCTDTKFEWKQNEDSIYNRAEVPIKSSQEIKDLARFMHLLIPEYNLKENNEKEFQSEINNLKNMNFIVKEKCEEIIIMKNNLEKELYKKFIVILNTKKEKIKELKTKLKSSPVKEESKVYNEKTDSESESDSNNHVINKPSINNKKLSKVDVSRHAKKKRKLDTSEENKIEPVASTSRENQQHQEMSGEEEEIELKFEDDKIEETSSAINQNDSEEMFFS